MRLRLRRRRDTEEAPGFSVDTSPYADRLRLAEPFTADDETRPTREQRGTYDRVIWYDGFCSERPLDRP